MQSVFYDYRIYVFPDDYNGIRYRIIHIRRTGKGLRGEWIDMADKRIKVKPGKMQSKLGFGVGILFVLIGCLVVIPAFGPFGIIWTLIACVITYSNYKNGFSDDGIATHEIIIEDKEDVTKIFDDGEDIEAKLIKLNSLYEQRLITKEEYAEKRKEFLKDF